MKGFFSCLIGFQTLLTRQLLIPPLSREENDEQAAGLPREFTFVFLIEQPVAKAAFTLQIGIKPTFSNDIIKKLFFDDEYIARSGVLDEELGQRFSSDPFNFATMQGQFEDLVELPGIAANIQVRRHISQKRTL